MSEPLLRPSVLVLLVSSVSCADDSLTKIRRPPAPVQEQPVCQPTAHAEQRCVDGDLYWFDSCGGQEEMAQNCCDHGCVNNGCVTPRSRCEAVEPVLPARPCADGIGMAAAFAGDYTCLDLGTLPAVPGSWGGLTIDRYDPDRLLLAGASNLAEGKIYAVRLARDADCHVVGFASASAEEIAAAPYIDGGLTYGPDDHLVFTTYPNNEVGFVDPGAAPSLHDLSAFGIPSSVGGLGFVPPGFGGAGALKVVSWPGGEWYTLKLVTDAGAPSISDATYELTLEGGPEGFAWIAGNNPGFAQPALLASDWSADRVSAYDVDGEGDPLPTSRRDFVVGLDGAEGAHVDALSGDYLFATWGGGDRLIVVSGFRAPPEVCE